ncbi:unnamed protein product [Symbiodinium sp. CCMP2456]|nr:unnamed protein product [Symbiodinium sp. CCMP2456]
MPYFTARADCGHSVPLNCEGRLSAQCSFQQPESSLSGGLGRSAPVTDESLFAATFDFWSWAAALPRLLLASRTAFARFLAGTLHLQRDDNPPPTALFPLPIPRPGCFGKDVRGGARQQVLLDRVLHVTVAALNFLHANCRPIPLHCLQKPPSSSQISIFDRLELLVRACSRSTGRTGCVPLSAGRRGAHLLARLSELSAHVSEIGLDGSVYPGSAPLGHVNHHDHGLPALKPYRDSDASRILIKGTGSWELGRHLQCEPELYLPFREPLVLRGIPENDLPFPGSSCDSKASVLPLIRLWDSKGLLRIVPGPLPPRALCRTFGAFKNENHDRLIGDRYTGVLVGASTDRADFYHQAAVSQARASTNCIAPALSLDDFAGLSALAALLPPCRPKQRSTLCGPAGPPCYYAAFGTLFQGDHGGVEYATSGHEHLLRSHGLLRDHDRLWGQCAVPHTTCFSVSVEAASQYACCGKDELHERLLQAESTQRVLRAQAAYASESVAGSPAKDLLGALTYQLAGAFVDSSTDSVSEGQVLVSAPPEKRLALSFLSLKTASLPGISRELAAALSGSWTSVLLFRKPLAACLGGFFGLGLGHQAGQAGSDVVALPRGLAQEIVLLSALAPIAATNVAVPFSRQAFCTDASLHKGAVVSAKVGSSVSEALWATAPRKGHYTMLSHDPVDQGAGCKPHDEEPAPDSVPGLLSVPSKARPLGLDFDFLEFGCASSATGSARALGLRAGPPFCGASSSELRADDPHVLDLVIYLISRGRLRSLLCWVPAWSFPWLSSRDLAFRPRASHTVGENERVALRSLVLLRTCAAYGVPCLVASPPKSGILRHPSYQRCLDLPTSRSGLICGAAFGSSLSGDLRWISVWAPAGALDCRPLSNCLRRGPSMPAFPDLCPSLARAIVSCLWAGASLTDPPEPAHEGLESALVNDVLQTSKWKCRRSWRWRERKHINVLESESAVQLYKDLAALGGDVRFCLFTDSSVVLGSHRKGRSTARLLAPSLRRAAAVLCAGGLYPSLHFAPTRANPADDPTRDKECREPFGVPLLTLVEPRELAKACRLTKPLAGWVRLFLLVGAPSASSCKRRLRSLLAFPEASRFGCRLLRQQSMRLRDFDATLGFPGEGPSSPVALLFGLLLFLTLGPAVGVLAPRHAADLLRQRGRSPGLLPSGRPVQPRTKANRTPLTAAFSQWLLLVFGFSLDEALSKKPFDHDIFCDYVIAFGNDLYASGRPYWHYSETINALTSLRPSLRKQLQGAWDLAHTWLADEPYFHHTAMPAPVLVAVLSTCLLWGWVKEAGIFALCFGALLRAGEAVKALRRDLVFPADALWGQSYILIRIHEPKTRGRAARHQSAKLEPADLVQLCSLAFEHLPKTSKIWPMSAQTLRKRFYEVLARLGMPRSGGRERPLDLGSLRPGGATYLLQLTEDSELVRRRGRWISHKIMEIYLQEVSASTFVADLDSACRDKVLTASAAFTGLLSQVAKWAKAGVPPSVWFSLWPHL